MTDFETYPVGYVTHLKERIHELERENAEIERLEERIEELEGCLRTESEESDLLSKQHYRERIEELEQRNAKLEKVREHAERFMLGDEDGANLAEALADTESSDK